MRDLQLYQDPSTKEIYFFPESLLIGDFLDDFKGKIISYLKSKITPPMVLSYSSAIDPTGMFSIGSANDLNNIQELFDKVILSQEKPMPVKKKNYPWGARQIFQDTKDEKFFFVDANEGESYKVLMDKIEGDLGNVNLKKGKDYKISTDIWLSKHGIVSIAFVKELDLNTKLKLFGNIQLKLFKSLLVRSESRRTSQVMKSDKDREIGEFLKRKFPSVSGKELDADSEPAVKKICEEERQLTEENLELSETEIQDFFGEVTKPNP